MLCRVSELKPKRLINAASIWSPHAAQASPRRKQVRSVSRDKETAGVSGNSESYLNLGLSAYFYGDDEAKTSIKWILHVIGRDIPPIRRVCFVTFLSD